MRYLLKSLKLDRADITSLPDLCQAHITLMPEVAPGLWNRILKALNVENGSQAAKKLGLSKQTVYEWKTSTPGLLTLIEIAESGNTSLDKLIRDKGEDPLDFLDSRQLAIVRKLAREDKETCEEFKVNEGRAVGILLKQLVSEALAKRGADLFELASQPRRQPGRESEQIKLLADLFDDPEDDGAQTEVDRILLKTKDRA